MTRVKESSIFQEHRFETSCELRLTPISTKALPVMEWDDFQDQAKNGMYIFRAYASSPVRLSYSMFMFPEQ